MKTRSAVTSSPSARAEAIIDAKWDVLTSKIDTRGPSAPVVVFNTLGWPRSDIAVANVGFGEGGAAGIVLTDSNGATMCRFRSSNQPATLTAVSRLLALLSSPTMCRHWDIRRITSALRQSVML